MASTTIELNLLSYNSTGWSDYKSDFLHTLMISHKAKVACIQEHFQLKSNLYKISRGFKEYQCFSIPAYKSNNSIHGGRPASGLSILYSKELSANVTHITVPDSHRVQAIQLKLSTLSYVLINCYFPTDPKVNDFDECCRT